MVTNVYKCPCCKGTFTRSYELGEEPDPATVRHDCGELGTLCGFPAWLISASDDEGGDRDNRREGSRAAR